MRLRTLSVIALTIFGLSAVGSQAKPSAEQIQHDCKLDQQRQYDLCVKESCQGVCTLEAHDRCESIGLGRWLNCISAQTADAPNGPRTPPKLSVVKQSTNDGVSK